MTSRLAKRLASALCVSLLAVTGAMMAQLPAGATDYHWQKIRQNPNGLKAEACYAGVHVNSQGFRIKAVRWRAHAGGATLGGAVQLKTISDRYGNWRSSWMRTGRGTISSATTTNFLEVEDAYIRMRVRNSNGMTSWSRAHRVEEITRCA